MWRIGNIMQSPTLTHQHVTKVSTRGKEYRVPRWCLVACDLGFVPQFYNTAVPDVQATATDCGAIVLKGGTCNNRVARIDTKTSAMAGPVSQ